MAWSPDSLNKLSPKFVHAAGNAFAEDNNCSKRPLSVLLRQIRKKGITAPDGSQFDEEIFWDDVETCVSSTITAMLPVLRVSYARSVLPLSTCLFPAYTQVPSRLGLRIYLFMWVKSAQLF